MNPADKTKLKQNDKPRQAGSKPAEVVEEVEYYEEEEEEDDSVDVASDATLMGVQTEILDVATPQMQKGKNDKKPDPGKRHANKGQSDHRLNKEDKRHGTPRDQSPKNRKHKENKNKEKEKEEKEISKSKSKEKHRKKDKEKSKTKKKKAKTKDR